MKRNLILLLPLLIYMARSHTQRLFIVMVVEILRTLMTLSFDWSDFSLVNSTCSGCRIKRKQDCAKGRPLMKLKRKGILGTEMLISILFARCYSATPASTMITSLEAYTREGVLVEIFTRQRARIDDFAVSGSPALYSSILGACHTKSTSVVLTSLVRAKSRHPR